jgi:hypothetical protein
VAASIYLFNNWRKAAQSGANLNGATLKATLHTSSYTPNVASQAVYADVSNELSTANGYANGGEALTGLAFNVSGATAMLTASPTVWTASGGSIVARYLVLRYVGTVNSQTDPLILYVLLDNTPADVTATTGNALTVTWSGSGVYVTS